MLQEAIEELIKLMIMVTMSDRLDILMGLKEIHGKITNNDMGMTGGKTGWTI
jgi:hypothetical protein